MKQILATIAKGGQKHRHIWLPTLGITIVLLLAALTGGSCYMLSFSLAPDPNRADRDSCYQQLFTDYPETKSWVDSLRQHQALRDTFVTMPSGERHHAYYINCGATKTALVIHGWRDQAIKYFFLARMYERLLGYNVVIPDLHAHGQSEGDAIGMGYHDRLDVLHWMHLFRQDTMVVHGVSMGAATTMMLSDTKELRNLETQELLFIADCGYTSVWEEFSGQLNELFGLPEFPLMHITSLLCQLRYGWHFSQASALDAVKHSTYPMLFIHGDSDTFVPTEMVYRLYQAKPGPKSLWITKNTDHAHSYLNHRTEYIQRVREFLAKY